MGDTGVDDPTRRLFLLGKLNVSAESTGLAYRLQDGRVVWESEPVTLTSDEYFAADEAKPERHGSSEQSKAEQLILEWLEFGPLESLVIDRMATDAGISRSSLHRAKERLGIKARKVGKVWQWSLPAVESVQDVQPSPTLAS